MHRHILAALFGVQAIAIVSDKQWVVHTLHALAWMMPGELAVFGLDELERAKQWAAG